MKVRMAGRVVGFLEAHGLGEGPAAEIAKRFGELYQRALERSVQQEAGISGAQAMTDNRVALRTRIQQGPLRHIRRIARAMEGQAPPVPLGTSRLVVGRSHEGFLASVQAILSEVRTHEAQLVANGMAPESLVELTDLVDELTRAVTESDAQRRLHTGATADLKGLTGELMKMVAQLDGIVRYQFRGNMQVLGEWESARNVAWPVASVKKDERPAA